MSDRNYKGDNKNKKMGKGALGLLILPTVYGIKKVIEYRQMVKHMWEQIEQNNQ